MNGLKFLLLLDRYVHTAAVVVTSNVANIPLFNIMIMGYLLLNRKTVSYPHLGVYRMFQRCKGNKYFWFHKQFVFFLILKLYLCLINQEKAHIFMDINEVHFIYFSPTRTSKQVGEAIVRGTGLTNVVTTNLTLHTAEEIGRAHV